MKQCEMSIACDAIKKLDNMENLNILTEEQTIEYLIKNKCSIISSVF